MPLLDLVCIECWTGTVGVGGTEEEIGGFGDIGIGKLGLGEGGMVGDRLGTDGGVTMGVGEIGRITSSVSELIGAWGEGML